MWILLLSPFLFANVITGEIDCEKEFFLQCKRPTFFLEIPRDVEVFKAQCPELKSYIECQRDYGMKCEKGTRSFEKPEKFADFIAVLDKICEEGSAWNEVVTSNLKCLNETFSNTNCQQEKDAFIESYVDPVYGPLDGPATSHIIFGRAHCLSVIHFARCLWRDIRSNCGLRAGLAAVRFIHRSNFVDASCPLIYRESLQRDLDHFNMGLYKKDFVFNELKILKLSDDD